MSEGVPALSPAELRWRCEASSLPFDSTADVEPVAGVVGQETAVEALRFGLECRARGQNIFVRGLTGTGRMTLLREILEELNPNCPEVLDRCYVYNFSNPDRPSLVSLPAGTAREFERRVDELADFVRDDLQQSLSAEGISGRRQAIDRAAQDRVKALVEPFERAAREADLAVVTVQMGPMSLTKLFPLVEDQPVPPEEFQRLHEQGRIPAEHYERVQRRREESEQELQRINREVLAVQHEHADMVHRLIEAEARLILDEFVVPIQSAFPQPAAVDFLDQVVHDIIERRLPGLGDEGPDFTRAYRVNVVQERGDGGCPVVVENTPTMANLLGGVDREFLGPGMMHSDHLMIRCGSLLRADGGYLVVEARDVLSEPGAWKVLLRTLRSGRLEITPPELSLPWFGQVLKPEAIDIDVKVVLLGESDVYYALDAIDPEFSDLFKVLADFESEVPRDEESITHYGRVLARLCRDEALAPFGRTAVAALVEHGARIAARGGKLTARFGRLADIAREGAFLATKAGRDVVEGADVTEAIARSKQRSSLPSRRFRELMAEGAIRVQTQGEVVGQINGLAVLQAGPMVSGFPARITATIGPGSAGVINIEREAALSGAIHTKGFYILGGLLRHLLQTDHPLAFVASVAFEQSYGGIDGDSASGAEICCLLSALTGVPIRQGLAMTGAIDQVGHILTIGAVNEKIEGFFDVCRAIGPVPGQGVIIPAANARDLMLRTDVVEACEAGSFSVYAVDTVHEALELLTGMPAGTRGESGAYPEGTLLETAVRRARMFWERAAAPKASGDEGPDEG